MDFFGLVTEIRLQIYAELLVLSEPIVFVADYGPPSPPLFRSNRDGLYPALLRVNKKVYREASPLLYSNNRFRFPNVFTSISSFAESAHIAPFLYQIGSQASFIRHICIEFPTITDYQHGRAIYEANIKNLELIRDTCTSIATLELLLLLDNIYHTLSDSPTIVEVLDLLNIHFKTISSLKEIIINFQVYGGEDLSNLMKKIDNYGWTAGVTKVLKKIWISDDDRVIFDNEEGCNVYNNERLCLDLQ